MATSLVNGYVIRRLLNIKVAFLIQGWSNIGLNVQLDCLLAYVIAISIRFFGFSQGIIWAVLGSLTILEVAATS